MSTSPVPSGVGAWSPPAHDADGSGLAELHDYSNRPARLPEQPDPANDTLDITLDDRLRMYEMQQVLRQMEKRAYDLFLQNLVKGTSHLSLGMEAVSAGVAQALRPDDYTFATYRGHAHTMARGAPLGPVLAELLGRENGILKGKGGSMHLASVEHNMMGSYAIIGAHLCIANGTAWSAQIRGTDQVTVAFFGDGATNIGAFHEALNMAAIWKLPVIFVCENNLYMEYTPIDLVTAVPNPAADRAAGYGLESIIVDGNDADHVYIAADAAVAKARSGAGPSLIEAKTYRQGGHSRADPGKYRPAEEIEAWLAHDPIPLYHQRMLRLGVDESRLLGIQQQVATRVDQATEFAKSGAEPGPEHLMTDVWADGGSSWRN
jgi:pyruvate dehydrogenase E1 component alpha subunit